MKLLLSSRKHVLSSLSVSHKYLLLPLTSSSSLSYKHSHLSSSASSIQFRFLSSSSSSSSSSLEKYEHFFPSFYNGYISHRIEWYYSAEPPHTRCHGRVDEELKNVLDKNRMNFPDLEKINYCRYDFRKENNGKDPEHWDIQHRVVRGESFDVVSFLSAHGDELVRIGANSNNTDVVKAENLRGKHVLVCCAFIPFLWIDEDTFWEKDASYWRQLSLLHSELSQSHVGSDFEIVIVARMRDGYDDDEGAFNHFYSAFPGCLAVPFTHKYRRDYICKCVTNFSGKSSFVLVDPSQKALLGSTDKLSFVVRYGARGFPFTKEWLDSLNDEDQWGWSRRPTLPCNLTLEGLLSCESDPASSLLCKLNSEETISVEQLNKNHVGLYLFKAGDKLKRIHDIYQQCKDNGLDFEIVLVPLSYTYSIHPKDFQDIVYNALKRFQVPNWWFLPYNNSVYLRLYNLSREKDVDDRMIIVGPHNEFVDKQGGKNIYQYSSYFGTQAYPFTNKAVLHSFLQRLEHLTLESFLNYDYVYLDYECDKGKMIPVTELKGKNVLVYMDIPLCLGPPWTRYDQVVQMFNKIKKIDPDFEMVFAPMLFSVPESEYPKLYATAKECIFKSKMKWLVRPFEDPKHSEIIQSNDVFLPFKASFIPSSLPSSMVAFGKDGRIHSLDALQLYWRHGVDPFSLLPESRIQTLCDELMPNFGLGVE